MWKILTTHIKKEIYSRLYAVDYFQNNKKGATKETRRTNDLLNIDMHFLKEAKTRREIYVI